MILLLALYGEASCLTSLSNHVIFVATLQHPTEAYTNGQKPWEWSFAGPAVIGRSTMLTQSTALPLKGTTILHPATLGKLMLG